MLSGHVGTCGCHSRGNWAWPNCSRACVLVRACRGQCGSRRPPLRSAQGPQEGVVTLQAQQQLALVSTQES